VQRGLDARRQALLHPPVVVKLFTTAASLAHELIEAKDERRLMRFQKMLSSFELLIVDELGFVPLAKTVTTLFGAPTMLAGIRLSQWSCEKPPAYQIVKIFADPSGDLQTLIGIYASFTERLYREPITPTVRCSVTRTFLDALGRRPGGMVALKSLRRLSSRVFGLNAIGQKQFDECFDLWMTHGSGPLIV
jgi:hypothetical protein